MSVLKKIFSYLLPLTIERRQSAISGQLDVSWENGRLALNAPTVNYSFNRLHRVMRRAIESLEGFDTSHGSVLNLGLGAGSSLHILRNELGHIGPITSVELDPVIVDLARRYFDLDSYSDHRLIIGEAAEVVNSLVKESMSYDLIIVDIFVDSVVPERMMASAFVRDLRSLLADAGSILFNEMNGQERMSYAEVLERMDMPRRRLDGMPRENTVLLYSCSR